MSDLFSKLREQIARQTRPSLGQAEALPLKGVNLLGQKPIEKTEGLTRYIRWDYFKYYYNRANQDFIPSMDASNSFFNALITSNEDIRHDFTPWNQTGSFLDRDSGLIKDGLHRAWGIRLVAKSNPILRATIGAGTSVNFAVWKKVNVFSKTGTYFKYVKIFEHKADGQYYIGNHEFNIGSSLITNSPVGQTVTNRSMFAGTEIWITTYSHKLDDDSTTSVESERDFAFVTNLYDYVKDWTQLSELSPDPEWYTGGNGPITSNIDKKTRNVINTLNIGRPVLANWKSINVYRSSAESVATIKSTTINSNNSVLLTSAEPLSYPSNAEVTLSGQETVDSSNVLRVTRASKTAANFFSNGDFDSDYTGEWSLTNNSDASIDSNYYYLDEEGEEPLFGKNSLKFNCQKSNTAKAFVLEASTSFYRQTNAISFSFWSKNLSVSTVGTAYARLIFRLDDAGTDAIDYNFPITNDEATNWRKTKKVFEFGKKEFSDSILLDQTYDRVLVQFYLATSQVTGTRYLIDGVKLSEYFQDDDVFNVATTDGINVEFDKTLEEPITDRTVINMYLSTTTNNVQGGAYTSTARIGPTVIISDSSYFKQPKKLAKFGKGYQITGQIRNMISGGDFSGSQPWTFDDGAANFTIVSSPTGAMFGNNIARFYTHESTTRSTYSFSDSVADNSPQMSIVSSAFTFSIWAKADNPDTKFYIGIKDNGTSVQSASTTLSISTSWQRYSISKRFSGSDGSNLIAEVSIPNTNTRPRTVYLDGATMSDSSIAYPFNTLDTAGTAAIHSANTLLLHSADEFWSPQKGTVRCWWTPNLAWDSGQGRQDYVWYRNGTSLEPFWRVAYNNGSNGKFFEFTQWSGLGGVTRTASVSGIKFKAHEPVHLVAKWNADSAWLVVNSAKSSAFATMQVGTNTGSLKIGSDQNRWAWGYITNFRVDTTNWADEKIKQDYYTDRFTPNSGASVPRTIYRQIGNISRRSVEGHNPIQFEDGKDLEPSTQYNYSFSVVDTLGNESRLSSSKAIITSSMPDFRIHGSSAAPRLIIGEEKYDSAYISLQPNGIFYHYPGTNTGDSVSFVKHIETGWFQNDGLSATVKFGQRFENWEGEPFVPHLIVAPLNPMTYSPAHSGSYQSFVTLPYSVTASGFNILNALVAGTPMSQHIVASDYFPPTVYALVGRWDGTTYTSTMELNRKYDVFSSCTSADVVVPDAFKVGYMTTALSAPNRDDVLMISFKTEFKGNGPAQLLSVRVFVNETNHHTGWPYNQTNFIKMYDQKHVFWPSRPDNQHHIGIFNFLVNAAKTIAIEVSTPSDYSPPTYFQGKKGVLSQDYPMTAFMKDVKLHYFDSAVSRLSVSSSFGLINYFASDGFIDAI